MDDSSAFVIVWSSYGPGVDSYEVFGQRFDAYSRIGNEFLVNGQVTGAQGDPAVARDPSGEFLVAWSETNGGSTEILAQRFDANAARIGDPFQVNNHTTGLQRFPAVAALGPSRFVVTWQSDQLPGQGARRLRPAIRRRPVPRRLRQRRHVALVGGFERRR
jgi:hypothetical protein